MKSRTFLSVPIGKICAKFLQQMVKFHNRHEMHLKLNLNTMLVYYCFIGHVAMLKDEKVTKLLKVCSDV